jgi:hypothetical protein
MLVERALIAASSLLRNLFPSTLTLPEAMLLLAVALALIFAGRQVVRVIAFIGVGLVFAAAGAALGTIILGVFGLVAGALIGFIIGGVLSLVLLPLAMGIAIGLIAYHLLLAFTGFYLLSLVIGFVFFIVGIILSVKLLSLATAAFGAFLLLDVLTVFFSIPSWIAFITALFFGALGFWVQGGFEHKGGTRFVGWTRSAPPASAVRVASSSEGTTTYCPNCGTRLSQSSASFCPNCGASLKH